jgi:sec-independent protein translocase protein TatB
MFGMGFTEILLIAIIAVIALGPEKLPSAMVEIAKFFKKFKSGIEDAKGVLDHELELTKLKDEAAKYKAQVDNMQSSMNMGNLENMIDSATDPKPKKEKESEPQKEQVAKKSEKVSFDDQDKKSKSKKSEA